MKIIIETGKKIRVIRNVKRIPSVEEMEQIIIDDAFKRGKVYKVLDEIGKLIRWKSLDNLKYKKWRYWIPNI